MQICKVCVIIGIHTNNNTKKEGIGITITHTSMAAKKRILTACVRLFIERGYNGTTVAEIIKEADVSASSFQNIFRSKDGVLSELAAFMFAGQFKAARTVADPGDSPAMLYAIETALQLTITELNDNLRDIYVEAYSHEATMEYIYQSTTAELYRIFGSYLPDYTESDFYELEIGSAGIMRGYMSRGCDMYFTLERKLERFLSMSLGVYNVPEDERRRIIDCILELDMRAIATSVLHELVQMLDDHFDFSFDDEIESALVQ